MIFTEGNVSLVKEIVKCFEEVKLSSSCEVILLISLDLHIRYTAYKMAFSILLRLHLISGDFKGLDFCKYPSQFKTFYDF